jgi:hypothetical protein
VRLTEEQEQATKAALKAEAHIETVCKSLELNVQHFNDSLPPYQVEELAPVQPLAPDYRSRSSYSHGEVD